MEDAMVLLIENNQAESTLACAALALRPEIAVLAVRDVPAAIDLLQRRGRESEVGIAILGRDAIGGSAGKLVEALSRIGRDIPVIGVAAGLRESNRKRAMAAGVRAVYDRPRDWKTYSKFMCNLVAGWLATRKDLARHPARTS
jgi:CheY-like chemotaxis protein